VRRPKITQGAVSIRAGDQENNMEAPPLERKLVAILAADVAGYSRLMESDEEGTLATLSTFRLVTDDLISRHGGRICGTAGDSILAAFASALAARARQDRSVKTGR
jgi:class 3 adenylate cyclase